MRLPRPSPELLELEARQIEHHAAYTAGVMRACAKQWREERQKEDK